MKSKQGPLVVLVADEGVLISNDDDTYYDVIYETDKELADFINLLLVAGREKFGKSFYLNALYHL